VTCRVRCGLSRVHPPLALPHHLWMVQNKVGRPQTLQRHIPGSTTLRCACHVRIVVLYWSTCGNVYMYIYIYIYIYIPLMYKQAKTCNGNESCSLPRMDCMNESENTLHISDYGVGKICKLVLWFRNGPARLAACIRYYFSPSRRSRTDTCTDTYIYKWIFVHKYPYFFIELDAPVIGWYKLHGVGHQLDFALLCPLPEHPSPSQFYVANCQSTDWSPTTFPSRIAYPSIIPHRIGPIVGGVTWA